MQYLRHKPEVAILLLCALLQIASALWVVADFQSPNAATQLAFSLLNGERYAGEEARSLYSYVEQPEATRRAFQLPGEILYQAAGFSLLPVTLWRLLHVPVVLLLVGAIVFCTRCLLGIRAAWAVGILACLHPFLFIHGPVWDDIFLAAALDWLVIAVLLHLLRGQHSNNAAAACWRWSCLLGLVAALAALTRLQSMLVLGGFAVLALLLPTLKMLRLPLGMILLGIAIGVGSWTWRNHSINGEWLTGSTHDGFTLWVSNYPGARASLLELGQVDANYPTSTDEAIIGPMTEWEADHYHRELALSYMKTHWREVVDFGGLKLAVTLAGIAPNESLTSSRNVVALATNVLFALAVLYASWHINWKQWSAEKICFALFLLTAVGSFVVLAFIGPPGWRYRMEIEGLLLMAAALFVKQVFFHRAGKANT